MFDVGGVDAGGFNFDEEFSVVSSSFVHGGEREVVW